MLSDDSDLRQFLWNTRPTCPSQYDGRYGTSFYSPDAGVGGAGDGRFGTSWFSQPSAIQAATLSRGQRAPNGEDVSTGGGTTRVNYDPRYAQYEPQAQRIYNGSPGAFAQVNDKIYPHGLDDMGIGDTSQMDENGRLNALRKFMRLKNIPGANQNLFEEQITGMSPIYRQAQAQKMQDEVGKTDYQKVQTDKERMDIAVAMQKKRLDDEKQKDDMLKSLYGQYDATQGDFDNMKYGYGGDPSAPFLHVTPHPRALTDPLRGGPLIDEATGLPQSIQDPAFDRPVAVGDAAMIARLRAQRGYGYGSSAFYNGQGAPPSAGLMAQANQPYGAGIGVGYGYR